MNPTTDGNGTLNGWGQALRRLRWGLRRSAARWRAGRMALAASPILFGNSFPKSGTHLLSQVLLALPRVGLAVDRGMGPILTFERGTGRQRAAREILADLEQLRPGDLAFGHVIAEPELRGLLCREGVAHFFMLRDPRDVVVSHAHYIGERAVHNVHHAYYKSLPDLDERLRVSILGRADFPGEFPDIGARFLPYLGWLDCPTVRVLRFEDFIEDRDAALAGLLDHAERAGFGRRVGREDALAALAEAIDPQKSYTFRRGAVGDWAQHFSEEHKALFKMSAGELLIRLGYEQDQDW